ncbi:hypothetical protein V6N12_039209 [Hibiscus sabdariffa]|uniref:Uncharacterized protein n=1 Tax=Hibiscus sabdariffa TaxID=183260 RepID=A0ABR2E014_9ROSI
MHMFIINIFQGLGEVESVEPFFGVHKYHLLKPPGPEVGYCTGPSPAIRKKMIRRVGATQVEEDILKYAEKIADLIMTVKSDETVMRDKEKEADSIMTVKSEETVMTDKEKEADLTMTVKSDETVMEDKEKEGYQNIKKRRYSSYGLEVYPAHPQLMISAPEKSTNTGRKLLEPEQKKDEEGRMMSHKVGATQVVEDIVRYAEKIVDSFRTMKSEETIMEDKENEGYQKIKKHANTYDGLDVCPVHPHQWVSSLEKSTHTGCKLLEPEQRKDEETSHMVGATQVEEDIVRYAEKIVDSYQNMKSEETVMEDKEKKGYQKFKKRPYTYDGFRCLSGTSTPMGFFSGEINKHGLQAP